VRTILLLIVYTILGLAAVPLLALCALMHWKRPIQVYSRLALGFGRMILGIRLQVEGLEQIDMDVPHIYMPNHLSLLDGPILFLIIPRFVRVILKRSVFRFPILGQAMQVVDFIPVDRKGRESGRISIRKAADMIQEKNVPFLIFPEGTRSRSGQLQRFRRGGFFLAIESGASIVPVAIKGTYDLLPPGAFFARKGTARVKFFQPISVTGCSSKDLPCLAASVKEKVREGLEEDSVKSEE
jgi:1-acyl-sn-glycerol-3-phosphate acyltransferase